MDSSLPILSLSAAVVAGAAAFPRIKARLDLSRAKHRSLTGHSRMSRRVARLLPFYEFSGDQYFAADGAPGEIASQRAACAACAYAGPNNIGTTPLNR